MAHACLALSARHGDVRGISLEDFGQSERKEHDPTAIAVQLLTKCRDTAI